MRGTANKALLRAARATKRYGWISFWVQLVLSTVSAVILLFSVAFTSQSAPRAALVLTMVGILAGFFSTAWSLGYTQMAAKMRRFLDSTTGAAATSTAGPVPKIRREQVVDNVTKGAMVNVLGVGCSLLGIQTLVGSLLLQMFSNVGAGSLVVDAAAGVYGPALALDAFLIQAATNTLLGHFLSLVCSLWLLYIVGEGRSLKLQTLLTSSSSKRRKKKKDYRDADGVISKGNAQIFRIDQLGPDAARSISIGPPSPSAAVESGMDAAARSLRELMLWQQPSVSSAPPSGNKSSSSSRSGSSPSSGTKDGKKDKLKKDKSARPVVGAATATSAMAYSAAASLMTMEGEKDTQGELLQNFRRTVGGEYEEPHRPLNALILPTQSSLKYLDGTLPGDYGFDPLGLFDPSNGSAGLMSQDWLRYAEVVHARWAMLGAAGCLAPEYLAEKGIIPAKTGVLWFKTGFLPGVPSDFDFGIDGTTLFWLHAFMISVAEVKRLQDYLKPPAYCNLPGSTEFDEELDECIAPWTLEEINPLAALEAYLASLPLASVGKHLNSKATGDPAYPGGPVFNPIMIVRDNSTSMTDFKEGELINGRIAMVACLGFCFQALITGQGPYRNLKDHMHDPLFNNIMFEF